MRWLYLTLLVPILFLAFFIFGGPKMVAYDVVPLEYDKALDYYYVTVNGEEFDVPIFDIVEEQKISEGMMLHCMLAKESAWYKRAKLFVSEDERDPKKWLESIYPSEGRGGAIFIWILSFLVVLMVLCLAPKEMTIIYADSD